MRTSDIFDVIENMETAPRVAAARAMANSVLARAIGAIRQSIRDRRRIEKEVEERTETAAVSKTDAMQEVEENSRAEQQLADAMQFNTEEDPLVVAGRLLAVHDVACDIAKRFGTKWDEPLSAKAMLDFMTTKTNAVPKALIEVLAKTLKVKPEVIEQMSEIQQRQDREQLIRDTPEILDTLQSIDRFGYEGAWMALDGVTQYIVAVKTHHGLLKARDNVIMRSLRSRSLSLIGSIPLLEDGAHQIAEFVTGLEDAFRPEISAAIEAGRALPSVDDAL